MRIGRNFREYGPMSRRRQGHTPDMDDAPPPERPHLDAERPPTRRARRSAERAHPEATATPTAAERVARRRTRRQGVRRAVALPRLLLGMVLVLGALLLALPYGLSWYYQGQALPGVRVQGIAVGGHDSATISAALALQHDDFVQAPLTVNFGGQAWQPDLDDLGVALDGERTAAVALAQGRTGDPLTRLMSLWQLWRTGIHVPPHVMVDRAQLQRYLMGLASRIDQPPRDAGLHLVDNRPVTHSATQGLQVLIDASANDIVQALETLQPQEITLRTRLLEPVIDDTAAQAAAAQAEDMLGSPLVLTHNDEAWTWNAEEIAHLLRIEPAGDRISVQIDPEQLTQEVDLLASSIDSGSAEPRLHYTTSGLEIEQPGQVGWSLQPAPAFQIISETLQRGQATTRTVELPADELHPRVVPSMLAELGIHELVGEGRSSFAGSAEYRITNIKAGAARMDGVLIAPGEEFSFNTQLGAVDSENGFVEGYAVVGNRTKLEWGGGVCQDSTTVFRAAFWAGLPITERHAHPFYISWYDRFGLGPYGDGAGLDAAIYTGLNDLRFVNDTGNWLLMQVTVDEANQVLTVQLYGTNPNNRQVTIDGPHVSNQVAAPRTPVYIDDASKPGGYFAQTDAARNGWDITIHRIVTENGERVSSDTFFTRFKAWPNVFVRGTGG